MTNPLSFPLPSLNINLNSENHSLYHQTDELDSLFNEIIKIAEQEQLLSINEVGEFDWEVAAHYYKKAFPTKKMIEEKLKTKLESRLETYLIKRNELTQNTSITFSNSFDSSPVESFSTASSSSSSSSLNISHISFSSSLETNELDNLFNEIIKIAEQEKLLSIRDVAEFEWEVAAHYYKKAFPNKKMIEEELKAKLESRLETYLMKRNELTKNTSVTKRKSKATSLTKQKRSTPKEMDKIFNILTKIVHEVGLITCKNGVKKVPWRTIAERYNSIREKDEKPIQYATLQATYRERMAEFIKTTTITKVMNVTLNKRKLKIKKQELEKRIIEIIKNNELKLGKNARISWKELADKYIEKYGSEINDEVNLGRTLTIKLQDCITNIKKAYKNFNDFPIEIALRKIKLKRKNISKEDDTSNKIKTKKQKQDSILTSTDSNSASISSSFSSSSSSSLINPALLSLSSSPSETNEQLQTSTTQKKKVFSNKKQMDKIFNKLINILKEIGLIQEKSGTKKIPFRLLTEKYNENLEKDEDPITYPKVRSHLSRIKKFLETSPITKITKRTSNSLQIKKNELEKRIIEIIKDNKLNLGASCYISWLDLAERYIKKYGSEVNDKINLPRMLRVKLDDCIPNIKKAYKNFQEISQKKAQSKKRKKISDGHKKNKKSKKRNLTQSVNTSNSSETIKLDNLFNKIIKIAEKENLFSESEFQWEVVAHIYNNGLSPSEQIEEKELKNKLQSRLEPYLKKINEKTQNS